LDGDACLRVGGRGGRAPEITELTEAAEENHGDHREMYFPAVSAASLRFPRFYR
jgi:hypothetical protein